MNHKAKLLNCLLLSGIFLFFCNQIIGQEKLNMSVGIGLPELFNIGARYQFKQAQIGISAGTVPAKNESVISASGDFYYHFAGSSKLSDLRPWYGRLGLNYLRDETTKILDKYIYLNVRCGRDFNISKKFGIEVDGGLMFQLYHDKTYKSNTNMDWTFDFNFPVLPSIGVALFYRF